MICWLGHSRQLQQPLAPPHKAACLCRRTTARLQATGTASTQDMHLASPLEGTQVAMGIPSLPSSPPQLQVGYRPWGLCRVGTRMGALLPRVRTTGTGEEIMQ